MGKFDEMNNSSSYIISREIDQFLESNGYTIGTPVSVYHHRNKGWENGYYSSDGLYYTRIHFTKDKITMYKEYNCGGHIDDFEKEIDPDNIESLEAFKEYVDDLFERINFE